MRIAELSRRTGVTKPTIKYYIREGLVPPGEPTSRNQAQYGDHHERRLRLVRALVEVGGLSIAGTRDLLLHIDRGDGDLDSTLGRVLNAVAGPMASTQDPSWQAAAAQVDELIRRRGWTCDNEYVRDSLIGVIAAFHSLGEDDLLGALDVYSQAAEQVAAADLDTISRRSDVDAVLDGAIVGTILGGSLLLALRRVAHVSASGRTFRPTAAGEDVNAGGGS